MESEPKEAKRGTLESFFSATSAKKKKIHQLTLDSGECSDQSICDNAVQSLTASPLILSTNNDETVSLDSKENDIEVSSCSIIEQCESEESLRTHRMFSIPDDISRSCNDSLAQPKCRSYKKNKENRSFQSSWYSTFSWLEYSEERDCAFCFYCRHFTTGLHLNIRNQSDSFTHDGYNNWKHALTKGRGFIQHNNSASHVQAFSNYQEYLLRKNSQTTVSQVVEQGRIEQIKKNRQRLIKVASGLLFCAKQMISFRGHEEHESSNNRGNFIELLKWSSTTDPLVQSILLDSSGNSMYLSPAIQNELLHGMANQIRIQIAEKTRGRPFALMADETRDVSGQEQLSIVVRVVSDEITLDQRCDRRSHGLAVFNEYFVGLVKLDQFDAQSLAAEIVRYLSLLNIPLDQCVAMCFDGASVMSGKHAGVQAILRQKYMPNALYVHCFAHRLNLVVCDVSKVVPYLSEFYSILSKIHSYFSQSSVTSELFKNVQKDLMLARSHGLPTTLKAWTETRWDSRWSSIDSVIRNYKVLAICFEELENEGSNRSIDAKGLLLAIKEPVFILTLFALHKIHGIIKILSDQLKAKSTDFSRAQSLIHTVIREISDLRSDQSFSIIFEQVSSFCKENSINFMDKPKERRIRNIPSRFKDVFITTTIGHRDCIQNEDKYKTSLYYPVIDSILLELKERFSDENVHILCGMSVLCPENDNFLQASSIQAFASKMNANFSSLCNEMKVLEPMVKDKKMDNIVDLYIELLPFKHAFPTFMFLLIVALTIPVSSTTCERTFSKMKLIKSKTRNTMSNIRLSDLCVLAIERDFDVDFGKVIDLFADEHKNSRILLK